MFMIELWINKRRWRWGWEKNRFGIGFQPVASIPVFVAFQSMLRMADWVGGKVLSNLLTHIHIQTQPRPLWLNTPEMCTHFFFYLCGASRQLPLYECSLSSGCCSECLCPSCGCRVGMRATVFADIWEGVYVLMPMWIHTQRLWMELIQAGPPRSACASLAATWVVSQPHHRPDEMSPSDSITHPQTSKKTTQYERSYRNHCRAQSEKNPELGREKSPEKRKSI